MRQIKKGSTNISVDLYIIDDTDGTPELGVVFDTSGIDLKYRRQGGAVVPITTVTLAALTTAHADGGFLEIGDGSYRLDLPDAAVDTGADKVTAFGKVTGMIVLPVENQLVAFDPEDATRLGLTALPDANADAAGGLPISDTGGLDLDALNTAAVRLTAVRAAVLTDWIDAGRLDAILDELTVQGDTNETKIDTNSTNLNTMLARLTAARSGYLDNLNIGGNVAGSSEVLAIQNNTRVRVIVPQVMERPDSSSTLFKLHLYLYDNSGNMEAPDSLPTITAENQSGTDRSSNLGTVTLEITGHYSVTYNLASGDSIEQLLFIWTVTEGGVARLHGSATQVVDTTAVDFTAADRTKLEGIQSVTDLLPNAGALTTIGTDTARLTAARAQVLDDWINAGRLDAILDELTSQGDTNETAISAIPTTKTGYSISTAGILAIWHQALTEIVTAGSVGKRLKDEITSVRMAVLTDLIDGGRLDLLIDAILAMLNAARGEPAQGAPPVNPDAMTKIDWLYKLFRNKKDSDGATTNFYADNGTTVDHKQTTSESGGTVTKGEIETGP